MDAQMMVATTIASFGGAAIGWLAARWIYRSEAQRWEALRDADADAGNRTHHGQYAGRDEC